MSALDFTIREQTASIIALAREFAQREIAPNIATWDEQESIPRSVITKLHESGLAGGVIPEKYGGAGMDYITFAMMVEELAKVDHVCAAYASFPSGLSGGGILEYGSEDIKQRYLVPFVKGERLGHAAVTEPGSGSDVAGMKTIARRDGNRYIINGSKHWISNLDHAEWFITFATVDPSLRHKGIMAFIVEKDQPGVSVKPVKNKLGYRPLQSGELSMIDVEVPLENVVAPPGEGFKVAMSSVENGRLGVAARACGVIAACLEQAVAYAQSRETFGRPIGTNQLIQDKIANMRIGLETARLLTYKLAWLKQQGLPARKAASMAKWYATDVLMKAATDAAQIFGAYCCSPDYPVNRYFRDAKIFQIVEGPNEIHRMMVAETELGYRRDR